MSKKISVIVPVYNSEKYIERAVESLINQSYENMEIILINDGSTDASLKCCKNLSKKDNRIIVIDKENSGVSSTRNIGIEKATGEYITFIDGDDYIDITAYEECMEIIDKYNPDFLKFSYYKESEKKKIRYSFKSEPNKLLDIKNKESYIKKIFSSKDFEGIWNLIIKKTILDEYKIRFDEKLIVAEDFKFMCDCFKYANNIYIFNKPFYHYVINQDSVTQKYDINKLIVRCDNIIKSYIESSRTLNVDIKNNPYCVDKIFNQLNSKLSLIAENESYQKFNESVNQINDIKNFQDLKQQCKMKDISNSYYYYLNLKLKSKLKKIVKRIVYR